MKGSSKPLSIFPPFKLHCWFKLELFFVCWEIFRCKTSGPEYLEDLECLKSLNPSQETAVRRAASYNNSGFVSIHGPPGTGYLVAKESPVCSTSIGGVVFFVHFLRGGEVKAWRCSTIGFVGIEAEWVPFSFKIDTARWGKSQTLLALINTLHLQNLSLHGSFFMSLWSSWWIGNHQNFKSMSP